jgi:salicylate hydroxylase
MGQGSHVLTFPVEHGERLNIVAFHTTDEDWDDYEKTTKMSNRENVLRDFAGFGEDIQRLLNLTNEPLNVVSDFVLYPLAHCMNSRQNSVDSSLTISTQWAIFDLGDNPVPSFVKGRVAISGDAAHATSPHHGAGAGLCIEDGWVLAELLADPSVRTPADLAAVLQVFDQCRRERGQWLVQSSRWIGDCYEWQAKGIGSDLEKIEAEIRERNSIIADFDIEASISSAKEDLQAALTSPRL